jgi:hypothetical protein
MLTLSKVVGFSRSISKKSLSMGIEKYVEVQKERTIELLRN